MNNLKHNFGLRMVKVLAVILEMIPFAACWYLYYGQQMAVPFQGKGNLLIVGLYIVLYTIFARVYDAFLISVNKISELIYSQGLSIVIADGIMFCVIGLLIRDFPNVIPALLGMASQILISIIWSVLAHKWYYAVFPPQKSMIVYGMRYGIEQLIREYGLEKKFDIQRILNVTDCLKDIRILEGMDTVFITGVQSHERNILLKYCVSNGIQVYVIPRIGDIIMSGAKRVHMFHLPMLRIGRHGHHPETAIVKRLFDIVASSVMLLMLSPVMIVTAIAIKLEDGGPVIYRQERLTKDGKIFNVLKFRSMWVDAEKDGVARLSTGEKDDRITRVGRVIRKVRIDELPQLLNILGGSMSIVGPRPERPEIAGQYEQELPEFRLRLQVKAGLTGYAQVYGKYNTTPYDKLQMDLMYIANPSIIEDLRIIFATIKILFVPESTDGVGEGQINAIAAEENKEETQKELLGAGRN